jgi:hypothetical protein
MGIAFAALGALWLLGIVLLNFYKNHVLPEDPDRPARYYNASQFMPWPIPPIRMVRLRRHRWQWQLGFALVIYIPIIAGAVGVVWFFRQLP